jgi:two-component system phosphate regulon sensor histidine kinase PhoR
MKRSDGTFWLAALALLVCAAWLVAWLAGLVVDPGGWPARLALTLVGLLLAGGSGGLLVHHVRGERRRLFEHFGALCDLDARDLCGNGRSEEIPPLPAGSPFGPLVDRVRQALVGRCREVQDLEHTQTALSIRARRAASQCEQVKAILSSMADPIIAVDAYDELVLANPAAESLFHFDAENTEQRVIGRLIACEKLVDLLTAACRSTNSSQRTEEIEIADAEGQSQWYRAQAARLPTGNPAIQDDEAAAGAVVVLRDIGRQKALQRRNAEFVSAVSHEMKTPLAGIKAYVELLVDGDAEDEETREEFLEVINGQADRLRRLVDNMLNLARIEAGVVNVSKENRSLNDILEEAIHVVQPSAEAKGIELVAELSPLYLGVLADRDMLLQSAINLLSNAIKYTPDGGRVVLRSRTAGEEVTFEVEDSGVGLSREDCGRVFEKFYRVKKDQSMASGTGLGLPLAKHIVEDVHGGRLEVESVEGVGSRFFITLPKAAQMT